MAIYMTPEAFEKLKTELHELLHKERPKIVESVSAAAAMGDRSENAEYIYGKKRLREIDRRVRFLQKRLKDAEVVDPRKLKTEKMAFGLWATLVDEDGSKSEYRVIGPDDVDSHANHITYDSPMGRALLGKEVGDTITVHRPKGTIELELIRISFTHSHEH